MRDGNDAIQAIEEFNSSRFDDTLIGNSPKPPSGVSKRLAPARPDQNQGKGSKCGAQGVEMACRGTSPPVRGALERPLIPPRTGAFFAPPSLMFRLSLP
jgi:hypothetical protein